MILTPTTAWSAPIDLDDTGSSGILQVRSAGDVYVAWSVDGTPPSNPNEGLRLRDGDTHLFGWLPGQQLWIRKGDGTSHAEVYIGKWLVPA